MKTDEILPYATFLTEALLILSVKTITRVGFKATFLREYKNMEDAVRDFFSTGMTRKIGDKPFGIQGKIDSPSVTMRVEGASLGCTATLQVRKRALILEVPVIGAERDFAPVKKDYLELVYDCDYFTTVDMELAQLKANVWINEAMHVIRRDSSLILGG